MTDEIPNSIKQIFDEQSAPAITLPAHVAGNICKMLERVQMTGMEAVAWVEAYQILQQIALGK